jgi:hypothetical protein
MAERRRLPPHAQARQPVDQGADRAVAAHAAALSRQPGWRRQSLLDEHQHTTRVERQGQYRSGALVLDIESMHHLKGLLLQPKEAGG